MWLDNLKELKRKTGMSPKQIADKTNLPERTVNRIFSGDTDNPYVDTLHRIVTALGGSLDDILADTKVVVATEKLVEVKETLAEVKENAEVVEAEKSIALAELEMLRTKTAAQEKEIALLNEKLQHKDELLALHTYYKAHIERLIKELGT